MKLNWEKGLFSSKYRILSSNKTIGKLSQSNFSSTTLGHVNDTKLKFKKKGAFSSETEILDLKSNQPIGTIKFSSWRSKATITIKNITYNYRYDNFWHSEWTIWHNKELIVKYKGTSTSGVIETFDDNEDILLCGLFLYNYYLSLIVLITMSITTSIMVAGN